MMLECWRHSAARRPSFVQLLDELVPDLSDDFRNVSYYYNREPDNDDDAADVESLDDRNPSVEDLPGETVPFRTPAAEPRTSSAPADSKVSSADKYHLADPSELQSSGFVGQPSVAERKQKWWNAELIEMSSPPTTATDTALQPGHRNTVDEELRKSRGQSSTGDTGASSCRSDVNPSGEHGSKDSSGSSLGSRKNGLINGHVIPFSGALSSVVH